MAKKGILEVLGEDVSWSSLRELLNYEIPLPRMGRNSEAARCAISGSVTSEEDLEIPFRYHPPVAQAICPFLVIHGRLQEEDARSAESFSREHQVPAWRALLQLNLVSAADLLAIVTTPLPLLFTEPPPDLFTDWLIAEGLLEEAQLAPIWKAARDRAVTLVDYLRAESILDDETIARAMAGKLGFRYEPLCGAVTPPMEALRMIPPDVLRRCRALPLRRERESLVVAFTDPIHVHMADRIGLLTNCPVIPAIAPRYRVEECLPSVLGALAAFTKEEGEDGEAEEEGEQSPSALLEVAVRGLVHGGGTDIHIEPLRGSTRVRYRIDGVLRDVMTLGMDAAKRMAIRVKSLAGMDILDPFRPQDGHLTLTVDGRELDFRVASMLTTTGEKLSLRRLQPDMAYGGIAHLGVNDDQARLLRGALALPHGLILTVGPTGSGKTSTLYCLLNSIDFLSRNIMTVEDPVEFDLPGVNQSQVEEGRGLTFAVGIRAILRHDPDTILVGEIRDDVTADITIRAALSGTLVLSSMHASSAIMAVSSLVQLGVPPFLVANALSAVIFQRLVRRVCDHCREAYQATDAELAALGLDQDAERQFWRGPGCQHCLHSGYAGRTGVFELLVVNDMLREAIATNPSVDALNEGARDAGLMPLRDHALQLLVQGVTTAAEIARIL